MVYTYKYQANFNGIIQEEEEEKVLEQPQMIKSQSEQAKIKDDLERIKEKKVKPV